MRPVVDDGSTSPALLSEVSDWQNHPAWVSFRDRYDPSCGAGATATASTMIRLTKSASASGSSWRTG